MSSWVILLKLQEIVFTSPTFLPITILCFVTLWITRSELTSMNLVSRLLTAASACCILVGLEVSFVFLILDCFVLCKSQNKMKPENKVPLNFKWMETNFHQLVFDFIQLHILSHGLFFQKILYGTIPLWRQKYSFTLCQI